MVFRSALAALGAVFLAACGGGDDSSEGSPMGSADVSVTAVGPAGTVPGGSAVQVVLTVSNAGPTASTNLVIAPNLNPHLEDVSLTCTASGGATCPVVTQLPINVPSLPADGVLVFQFNGVVGSGATGQLVSTAVLATTNDPSLANNTSDYVISTSSTDADVTVSVFGPGLPVVAGGMASYRMVVRNEGPQAAGGVAVALNPSANQTLGAVTCEVTGGAACPSSAGATMVIPSLPVGSTVTFSIPTTVAAGSTGTVSNVMTASSGGDPDTSNNSGSVQTTAFVGVVPTERSIELASNNGDYIGQGSSHSYTPANAVLTATLTGTLLRIQVAGSEAWDGYFQLPASATQFEVGSYTGLMRYPFHNTVVGGLDWSGQGRGCNTLGGAFTVNSVSYVGGQLSAIDLSFEQHCEGAAPALWGRVRWTF